MLIEPNTRRRQDGNFIRRWFTDEDMDLYLWFDRGGTLRRLQLCYDKARREHVLSWSDDTGFRHDRVDSGDQRPGQARSPILVMNGACDPQQLRARFLRAGRQLDADLFDLVHARLLDFERVAKA